MTTFNTNDGVKGKSSGSSGDESRGSKGTRMHLTGLLWLNKNRTLKIVFTLLLISLAFVRLFRFELIEKSMDNIFLILLYTAVLLPILPLDKITSFSAANMEIKLSNPQVTAALSSTNLNMIDNIRLREELSLMDMEIQAAHGSRILWIDDRPCATLSARKLLRTFGIEIVFVTTSTEALILLEKDQDFDLILTDVNRTASSVINNECRDEIEGVNFILKIHDMDNIPKIEPVFFVEKKEAGGNLGRLIEPLEGFDPKPVITYKVNELLPLVIRKLSAVRTEPLSYSPAKDNSRSHIEKNR